MRYLTSDPGRLAALRQVPGAVHAYLHHHLPFVLGQLHGGEKRIARRQVDGRAYAEWFEAALDTVEALPPDLFLQGSRTLFVARVGTTPNRHPELLPACFTLVTPMVHPALAV